MMDYLFKHVLVQETTYASLLKHDRQRLHHVVAAALEAAEPERLDENAARLAQHYYEAGDDDKCLEFSLRAGANAAKMFAHAEAIEQLDRALAVLKRGGGTARDYLEVYLRRGRAMELLGEFELALENYLALEDRGTQLGDATLELAGLSQRATIYATPTNVHDPRKGEALSARALELARELGDRAAECKILWNLQLVAYFDCNPKLAVEYGERALALARELGLREREAYILNDISRPLISIGPISRSLDVLEQARALFRAQNNLPMLADNFAATSETMLMAGEFARGLEFTQQAVELSRTLESAWNLAYSGFGLMMVNMERGNLESIFAWSRELYELPGSKVSIIFVFGARAWIAEAYRLLGDPAHALELSREMVDWAFDKTYPLAIGWLLANVVRDLTALGELEQAQQKLDLAYRQKMDEYSGFGPIYVRLADAELALAAHNPARALAVCDEMLRDLERLEIHFYRTHIYHARGKALLMLDDLSEAADAFQKAHDFGDALPMRRILWETYALWAAVEQQRGNLEHARTLRAQARAYLYYIADHTGNAAFRESFLSQLLVRKYLPGLTETTES